MYTLYHNVLTKEEHELCYNNLRYGSNWEFTQVSAKGEDGLYFWYNELSDDSFYNDKFLNRIKEITKKNFSLDRVYANGQTYGLPGSLHTDSKEKSSYTFLYYVNKEWDVTWGGSTIFYHNNEYKSMLPLPNCGILFAADKLHAGLEPTRHCKELRITVAFKLKCLDE